MYEIVVEAPKLGWFDWLVIFFGIGPRLGRMWKTPPAQKRRLRIPCRNNSTVYIGRACGHNAKGKLKTDAGHTHFGDDFCAVHPEKLDVVHICCRDELISRTHAEVTLGTGSVVAASVRDCGSKNGTHVLGAKGFQKKTYFELRSGDKFRCGKTVFTVIEVI